jgi:hypothetical protein
MNDNASLLSAATVHIFDTFAVSQAEAKKHAEEFLDLIESMGGEVASFDAASLCSRIDDHLGRVLPWKSESRKRAAEEKRKERSASYNEYLNAKKSPWERQW